jgi:ribosomal protein L11 methyltransferase
MAPIHIAPFWRIEPARGHGDQPVPAVAPPGERSIILGSGPGFGDGRHETTQLCLQAVASFARRDGTAWRMLDFGSGSGILAVGAAKLGAIVDAVEIDEAAIESAAYNATCNAVAGRIRFARTLGEANGPYDVIVANILRAVLVEHAEALSARLREGGAVVLSGLVATDVPDVSAAYCRFLRRRPEIVSLGEWHALAWLPAAPPV